MSRMAPPIELIRDVQLTEHGAALDKTFLADSENVAVGYGAYGEVGIVAVELGGGAPLHGGSWPAARGGKSSLEYEHGVLVSIFCSIQYILPCNVYA